MERLVLTLVGWLVTGGCGFRISTGSAVGDASPSEDAAVDGAGGPGDGPGDAMVPDQAVMVPACSLKTTGSSSPASLLGGSSGNRQADLACSAGRVGVGLQLSVSPGGVSNHDDQILVTTVRLWCGVVARSTMNQWTTTDLESFAHTALVGSTQFSCSDYQPEVALPAAMCPAGSVLVGVEGHQVDSTLYDNVSIRCATLGADGAITATTSTIAIAGSGGVTANAEATTCPATSAIISLHATSGCGQDGLTATCSLFSCTP